MIQAQLSINEVVSTITAGTGVDMSKFLNIKEMFNLTKAKEALNITEKNKIELTALLLDRWMLMEDGKDSMYVKHIYSGRKNTLYQIILSGQEWDGIYEFVLKGQKINTKAYTVDNKNTLVIDSNGNYPLAAFQDEDKEEYTICRMDFETDEEFRKALVETGFVSEEDVEIYHQADDIIKPYLNKVLPRVIFK